jgi:hypothetical protein
MKKQTFSAIQKLLRSGKNHTNTTKVWAELVKEEDIGRISGKEVVFTPKELSLLRSMANTQTTSDVIHVSLSGSREEMSNHFINEKYSNSIVFGDLIWGAIDPSCQIPLKAGEASIPFGTFLSFPLTELDISRCPLLLVIENGEVFRKWHQLNMPRFEVQPLVVYRGHNHNQREVIELVSKINQNNGHTIGFFDYDPKGFCMAHKMNVKSVLLPTGWKDHHREHDIAKIFNKNDRFIAQKQELENQLSSMKDLAHDIGHSLLNGKWSLTQEHILAHKGKLVQVPAVDF